MSHIRLGSAIALLVGGGTFAATWQIETALTGAGLLTTRVLIADVLLAVAAASGLILLLRHLERRRELLRRQVYDQVSDDLNHHIRNALQLILNYAEILRSHSIAESHEIRAAVNRIDWALREILPRGYHNPRHKPPRYSRTPGRHLRHPETPKALPNATAETPGGAARHTQKSGLDMENKGDTWERRRKAAVVFGPSLETWVIDGKILDNYSLIFHD
jgi:hypothetical protein